MPFAAWRPHIIPTFQIAEDRIDPQPFGVVHVLVTGKARLDRLAQQTGQGMVFVQTASGIGQTISGRRETGLLIEFPLRQQTAVTRQSRNVKLQAHRSVEINAQSPPCVFTHRVPPSLDHQKTRQAWPASADC